MLDIHRDGTDHYGDEGFFSLLPRSFQVGNALKKLLVIKIERVE